MMRIEHDRRKPNGYRVHSDEGLAVMHYFGRCRDLDTCPFCRKKENERP
jgi:hypothetical protein